MKILFDDWNTACNDDDGFVLEMQCVPKVNDLVIVPRSMMDQRYFEPDYFEDPDDNMENFEMDEDVEIYVAIVQHRVTPEGHCIEICFSWTQE